MQNKQFNGVVLVALGAASYGILAALVKLAYQEGYSTIEVCAAQALVGLAGLALLNMLARFIRKTSPSSLSSSQQTGGALKLVLAGTSMGLTSLCYYWAVRYVAVSVAIVLLMQSVWMGVALEAVLNRQLPSRGKLMAVVVILAGTLLATNVFMQQESLNTIGVMFGLAAAASYTAVLFVSNRVSLQLPPLQRAFWILCGGTLTILVLGASSLFNKFDPAVFLKWGLLLGLFGTILPPMLFSLGMPKTGVGLGTIVAAVELPVSVLAAYWLTGELVNVWQWCGILLILLAIVLMHVPGRLKSH